MVGKTILYFVINKNRLCNCVCVSRCEHDWTSKRCYLCRKWKGWAKWGDRFRVWERCLSIYALEQFALLSFNLQQKTHQSAKKPWLEKTDFLFPPFIKAEKNTVRLHNKDWNTRKEESVCPGLWKSWSPGRSDRVVHVDAPRQNAGKPNIGKFYASLKSRFKPEAETKSFKTFNTHEAQTRRNCPLINVCIYNGWVCIIPIMESLEQKIYSNNKKVILNSSLNWNKVNTKKSVRSIKFCEKWNRLSSRRRWNLQRKKKRTVSSPVLSINFTGENCAQAPENTSKSVRNSRCLDKRSDRLLGLTIVLR